MELINNTIKFIESSFRFDHHIGNKDDGKALSELNNMKTILSRFNRSNDLYQHVKKLGEINLELMNEMDTLEVSDQILSTLQTMHKSRFCKSKNTIILFYSPSCKHSINFLPIWNKMNDTFSTKFNMILVNVKNPDYSDVCQFFNIVEYPTLYLVTKTTIIKYTDEHDFETIKLFLQLKSE